MREVCVVGVGMVRFDRYPERPLSDLGAEAVLAALHDAGLAWREVQAAYSAVAGGGMTPGTRILGAIGLTGIPIANVENASASGSTAFREAYLAVASGLCDVAIAVGAGKMTRPEGGLGGGEPGDQARARAMGPLPPAGLFAMLTRRRMHDYGTSIEPYALVSVKNHKHGAQNPFAQFQKEVTLEEVQSARMVCDPLTVLHCCPTGDGAAAAIVASSARARALGSSATIGIAASAFRSELYRPPGDPGPDITALTAQEAYEQAALGPEDIDLVQVHDAFTIEEIEYCESLGFCGRGEGERLVLEGATTVGGRIPFSTDGGLLARGHPIGPTGLAQIWETVMQLRGAAGGRQVGDARVGLCHMIGAGGVCLVHILQKQA